MVTQTGIEINRAADRLEISWDNRTVRKPWGFKISGRLLVLFWIAWLPITLFATLLLLVTKGTAFLLVLLWAAFAWCGVFAMPATFRAWKNRESILLDNENLTLTHQGWRRAKVRRIPLRSISEISFGYILITNVRETEVSLNIWAPNCTGLIVRRKIAYFIAGALKLQAFEAMQAFIADHNLKITTALVQFPDPTRKMLEEPAK
jgi:hypothetical protein